MRRVTEKFTKKLEQHKKLVANMFKTEDKNLVIPVQRTAEELALAYAGCKCEKCKRDNGLQYHHLIQRYAKGFMDFWKYMSQRYYWANILILCRRCHGRIENIDNQSETISEDYINKIKKKYSI